MKINKYEKHICDLVNCGNLKKDGDSFACSHKNNPSCIFNTELTEEEMALYKEYLKQVKNKKKAFRLVLLNRLKKEVLLLSK